MKLRSRAQKRIAREKRRESLAEKGETLIEQRIEGEEKERLFGVSPNKESLGKKRKEHWTNTEHEGPSAMNFARKGSVQ